jgi:hypothetical protein
MFSMAVAGPVKSLIAVVGAWRATQPGPRYPCTAWRNHGPACRIAYDSDPGNGT